MIFSISFLYHPLLFSFLVQRKTVPVPLEALALLPVNFFSLLVQRALNLKRHNTTRLFIPSVALSLSLFYRTRGSRKQNRGLSSFASFSQPAPQDPTRRVSYPWTDTLITKYRGADVIQTGHQVAPFFFLFGTFYWTGWTHEDLPEPFFTYFRQEELHNFLGLILVKMWMSWDFTQATQSSQY